MATPVGPFQTLYLGDIRLRFPGHHGPPHFSSFQIDSEAKSVLFFAWSLHDPLKFKILFWTGHENTSGQYLAKIDTIADVIEEVPANMSRHFLT